MSLDGILQERIMSGKGLVIEIVDGYLLEGGTKIVVLRGNTKDDVFLGLA